jgi:hypothetical protein
MTRAISRRFMLRGLGGVSVGLPLLEAMLPARAHAAAAQPRRFLVWATPNGTIVDRWICPVGASPSDFTLSEILTPLERHKADMVGVQNLRQYAGYGHEYGTTLTGRNYIDKGYPKIYATGPSLDQVIAKRWEGQTPLPSLQIGVQVTGARETSGCMSWTAAPHQSVPGATQPLAAENNPFALFARLFSTGTPQATAGVARSFSARRSVLDSVLSQSAALEQRLGRNDRAILDNYLESVRSIEMQTVALATRAGQCAPPKTGTDPTAPGATTAWWLDQANVAPVIKLHADLIAAVFACDLTRVITLTVAGSGGDGRRPPAGLPNMPPGDWHGISHMVEKGNLDALTAIEKWYHGQLAVLLDSLKAARDATGASLLASSLVLTINEYGPNGAIPSLGLAEVNNSHRTIMMPILLFGQAGGALKTGRWVTTPLVTPNQGLGRHTNQLWVSILNGLGIPDQTFGDPRAMQGPLPGVFA